MGYGSYGMFLVLANFRTSCLSYMYVSSNITSQSIIVYFSCRKVLDMGEGVQKSLILLLRNNFWSLISHDLMKKRIKSLIYVYELHDILNTQWEISIPLDLELIWLRGLVFRHIPKCAKGFNPRPMDKE